MVKTLYFVRHGQTRFNLYQKVQGACDSPLTDLGIEQAKAARQYFLKNNINFDLAFVSPQNRARDTLEIITDQSYTCLKELKEKDYGVMEGEAVRLLPWKYSSTTSYPSMEPNENVLARMEKAVEIILNKMNDGQSALVVGHGNIMGRYIHEDIDNTDFPYLENCSIVKVDYENMTPTFREHAVPMRS